MSCPFLKQLSVWLPLRDPQQVLGLAGRCPVAKRVFAQVQKPPVRHQQTAAAATLASVYPPVCDGTTNCILKRCPYEGQNKSKLPRGDVKVPSTCALFQSSSKSIMSDNALPQEKTKLPPDQFHFGQFFEDQLEKKRSTSTYRVFRRVLRDANDFPYADEYSKNQRRRITIWCSNDYLGMSRHPKVREAARNAISMYGVGSGGTRNISGNSVLHEALEHELANLHGKGAGLVFSSCYVANEATLHTMGTLIPNLNYFSDAGNHASMIHGIRTSRAPKHIFRANDFHHLDEMMSATPANVPKMVVFETVHSMTGDICPLKDLLDVCERHNAFSFVDEVHAVGLYGQHGAGVAEQLGVMPRISAITGTLGKAFASFGGYLVGDSSMVDMIRSYASGFIFTTSLPPATIAAARASIAILGSEEGVQLRAEHQRRVKLVRNSLIQGGLPALHVPSHIVPILIGDAAKCNRISEDLLDHYGIYLQPINYPTVPRGEECLRLAPSPFHTDEQMNRLVESLVSVWKANGLSLSR